MADQTGSEVAQSMRDTLRSDAPGDGEFVKPPADAGKDAKSKEIRLGFVGWSIIIGMLVWLASPTSNAPVDKTDIEGHMVSRFIGTRSAIACSTPDLLQLAVGYIGADQTDKALAMIGPCTLFDGGQEVSVLDQSVFSGLAHIRYFNPNRVYPQDFYTRQEWLERVTVAKR
jgi:hypothetical protein